MNRKGVAESGKVKPIPGWKQWRGEYERRPGTELVWTLRGPGRIAPGRWSQGRQTTNVCLKYFGKLRVYRCHCGAPDSIPISAESSASRGRPAGQEIGSLSHDNLQHLSQPSAGCRDGCHCRARRGNGQGCLPFYRDFASFNRRAAQPICWAIV